MAATTYVYAYGLVALGTGAARWDADNIKMALYRIGYTPNVMTHRYRSDAGANETFGGTYTAGGLLLSGRRVAPSGSDRSTLYYANRAEWPDATFDRAVYYGLIYKDTGDPATDLLLAYVDLQAQSLPLGNTFIISWPSNVVMQGVLP